MKRVVAGLVVAASLLVATPAQAYPSRIVLASHHCRYDDCDDRGSGDGNGNSGGDYGHGQGGDQDGRGNCHSFCNWTIPGPLPIPGQQPKGFLPPNPAKIPQQIADFVKVVADFVQAVLRFAV